MAPGRGLLWFLSFTDYSLVGSWPDVIFPIAVGLAAFIALAIALPRTGGRERALFGAAHLPALLGGGLFVLRMAVQTGACRSAGSA